MKKMILAALIACASLTAFAQITVTDPWIRATVPHQQATGAFMQLSAAQDTRLVEVVTPLATVAEVHEMKLDNGVMKMRAMDGLPLLAHKPVTLQPGGLHIMLMGLKRQVKEGELVPVTLIFEGRDNKRESVEVKVPVRPLAGTSAGHDHGR